MRYSTKGIDPEPFGIAVGIAGIVGGFVGAVSLYRDFSRTRFRKSHRAALSTLHRITKVLAEIDKHIAIMERLSAEAIELETQPVWLGSRVLMVPVQFKEYAQHAEHVISKLRRVLSATHRLERLSVQIPYVRSEKTREIVELNLHIEKLWKYRHRNATETLTEVRAIVVRARRMTQRLLEELGGPPPDETAA